MYKFMLKALLAVALINNVSLFADSNEEIQENYTQFEADYKALFSEDVDSAIWNKNPERCEAICKD